MKIKSINAHWIVNDVIGLDFMKELVKQNNKDMFESQYVGIIIEFLYNKFSSKIIKMIMPLFFLNYICIFLMIILGERSRQGFDDDMSVESEGNSIYQLIVTVVFALSFLNFAILALQTMNIGRLQLYRGWAWLDLAIFINTFAILLRSFRDDEDKANKRIIEAVLLVLVTLKSLYFLRLFGEIAPLIDIIFMIMNDIYSFLLIYIIALLCFVVSYYILGQNQKDLATTEEEVPYYSTMYGAWNHVFRSSLGDFDTDYYN